MSTDTSWMLWDAQPPKLPQPRPGEPLFALVKDHRRIACELRYHDEYGVEAQFLEDGELTFSRRFDTKAQAVQWTDLEGDALRREGWVLVRLPRTKSAVAARARSDTSSRSCLRNPLVGLRVTLGSQTEQGTTP